MDDRADFLRWFDTTWRAGDEALHRGDAEARSGTWSAVPPVTLFGAWYNAQDPESVHEVFGRLARSFSGVVSFEVDVVAAEVSGDLAYTAHRELTTAVVDGVPRSYVLRVTQAYRREEGGWRVVHRHGDEDPERRSSG